MKGLELAKTHGYNLEVQSFERRLSMLEKSMPRAPYFRPLEDTSDLADKSASADSEINIFPSGSE